MISNTLDNGFPMKLASPARRALAAGGIERIEQLASFRKSDVRQWHGIGPNALKQLEEALSEAGLSFADEATEK